MQDRVGTAPDLAQRFLDVVESNRDIVATLVDDADSDAVGPVAPPEPRALRSAPPEPRALESAPPVEPLV